MTPEATISISLLIAIFGAIGVYYTIRTNIKATSKQEEDRRIESAEQFTKLNVKLDQFYQILMDLSRKSEAGAARQNLVDIEVAKHTEQIETLYRLSDQHEEKLKELESLLKEKKS